MPIGRRKEGEESEDLDASGNHKDHERNFGRQRESGIGEERGEGVDERGGAEVCDVGCSHGESSGNVAATEGEDDTTGDHKKHVEEKESEDLCDIVAREGDTVEAYREDHVGMEHAGDVVVHITSQNHDTLDLDAAAGAARGGTEDDEEKSDDTDQRGPIHRVVEDEATGGYGGRDVEEAVAERMPGVAAREGESQEAGESGEERDGRVGSELVVAEEIGHAAVEEVVKQSNIDAAEPHKQPDKDQRGDIGGGESVGGREEPSGADGAESEAERGAETVAAGQETCEQDNSKYKIDLPHVRHRSGDARVQLALNRAGEFGVVETKATHPEIAVESHNDEHKAQAAEPLGDMAPKEEAERERLGGRDDRRARGSESRYTFEDSVSRRQRERRQHERDSPRQRDENPGKGSGPEAFAAKQLVVVAVTREEIEETSEDDIDSLRDEQGRQGSVVHDERDYQREEHGGSQDE